MDFALFFALGLSQRGFGPAAQILDTPTDLVLGMRDYARFMNEYQETAGELAREART